MKYKGFGPIQEHMVTAVGYSDLSALGNFIAQQCCRFTGKEMAFITPNNEAGTLDLSQVGRGA